ncbi:hypothetical protein [Salipiger sp. PrR003]|uniref:hypothetical protein n=1 Tax=Salipiger sp. PrR003 TaxID=2706776 RepID=UPI0013DBA607|nr:hypothetical protein [Salipiger sp. PrR003]NDV51659.1 hypothetical protein [Salipiger sp. PrR003]
MTSFIETTVSSSDSAQPPTVIVLGPPRSGTSMISGILRLLGIYMGECNPKNNEDQRFNKTNDTADIEALISQNNTSHGIWGWKHPSTHIYYESIAGSVRNPFFIASFRNVLDAAASKLKHTGSGDPLDLIRPYASHYVKISSLIAESGRPCIYVNYDKAAADPVPLAEHLAQRLLGRTLEDRERKKVTEYCTPGSYKSIDELLD